MFVARGHSVLHYCNNQKHLYTVSIIALSDTKGLQLGQNFKLSKASVAFVLSLKEVYDTIKEREGLLAHS